MSCWDGMPPPRRDEDESEWHDSDGDDGAWRGDVHLGDWPENLAGPEYWLYRKQRDEDEES